MTRQPYHVLRANLRAAIYGHDELVDHIAFSVCAEASMAGVTLRTLVLAEPGAGVDHIVDTLARYAGLPTHVYDLDVSDLDSVGHEEAQLRHALLRLGQSADSNALPPGGALLVLRGFVGAAAVDRADWWSGGAMGARIAAAQRVVRQRVLWTAGSDSRPAQAVPLAVLAIDDITRWPHGGVGTEPTRASNIAGVDALIDALALPRAFVDEFPRRFRILSRTARDIDRILVDSQEVRAVLDAAFALGYDVCVSAQSVRYLAGACTRGELRLRHAIDLLCATVERVVRGGARPDPFADLETPVQITPDDLVLRSQPRR
jgi:hypothetical protein